MNLGPSIPTTTNSATQEVSLGTRYRDQYGRTFHYAQAGAANLARGKLTVTADGITNHTNMSFQAAPAKGAKVVSVTLGATALTANQYKDGWFVVEDGTGEGRAYRIEGHAAATSAGTATIYLAEPIDTAGALSEANCDLVYNKYDNIVISAADQSDPPVGVPVAAITANYYGWVQTWGPCSVLQDEAVAIGDMITIGASVTGAVEAVDEADAADPIIGVQGPIVGVDTEYQLVYLMIDP